MVNKKLVQTKTLPVLPRLVLSKSGNRQVTNKCYVLMSSLLNCWAANGEGSTQCAAFEHDLKTCMETTKPTRAPADSFKYHANRLYPKFTKKLD
ncbi:hypothetical protein PUMCH_000248 [Australozyma saopauloensis]|uniref:37S ribosomal protein mrp10, mitochondrial n=1 Tax=Australozyma saopauloensis TaxID=291208 RepID=A0AAX4H3Z7_9ASCO|nr:hypothetical protein PUMCH_000248 [[Candida] saopauloensis]